MIKFQAIFHLEVNISTNLNHLWNIDPKNRAKKRNHGVPWWFLLAKRDRWNQKQVESWILSWKMITYQKQHYPATQLRKNNHKNVKNQQYHPKSPKSDFSSNQKTHKTLRDFQTFHPGRLTWNIIIEVWFRSFFLSKWVICSLNVHLPGCFVVDFVWVALAFLHTPELHRSPSHPRIPARPWRAMDLPHHAGYLDTLGQRWKQWVFFFFPTKNVENICLHILCISYLH